MPKGNNITLSIYAGAGGQDAEDWALMLLKMYQKYSEKKNWKFSLLTRKKMSTVVLKMLL